MASWKKVIVSGSHADLAAVTASSFVGALVGNADTATSVGNALTVDNATIQLNSGTTYNGSAARTISIKDGGVDADALASAVAGNGLTGGGGSALAVGAGTGIDVAADAISVDVSDFMTNGSNNRIVTATGTDAMNAEANLTFDGSSLTLAGRITASGDISSSGTILSANSTIITRQYFGGTGGSNAFISKTDGNLLIDNAGLAVNSHITASGNISASGTITANAFVGDGSGLTGLTSANNSTITIAAGDGLKTGGSFTLNQSGGATITLDFDASDVAGDGLGTNGEDLKVNVDDSSIEINSDTVRVKASGITNAMLAGSIADSKLSTITTANKVGLAALDIDGGTDIGAALVDADLMIVDDGAGGTNRKATMSRLATYMQSALTFTTNTDNDVSVANLKTALAGGFGSNAVQIGDSNDVVTIGNKLIVTGDLQVNGTTTTVDTTNLNVTDQFINLNDGGSAADGGLVVEGAGVSYGWDNSAGRWAFLSTGATEGMTTIAQDAFAAAVVVNDNVAAYRKNGNIRVESDEIYIYVE